jgi:hypothetical protein
MDLENVDTIRAFGAFFLGGVVAAFLIYAYQGAVRPHLLGAVSGAPAGSQPTAHPVQLPPYTLFQVSGGGPGQP